MDEFYRTRMGATFFNHTLPKIAEELERLNRNLEALVDKLEARDTQPKGEPGGTSKTSR